MIVLKSKAEIEKMREAGRLTARTGEVIRQLVAPGVTTAALNRAAEDFIRAQGGVPAFLGYNGFPASICASINDEVVHGIPSDRRLTEGDIISLDFGVVIAGYYGDMAFTLPVGEVSDEARRLIEVTEGSLYRGIEAIEVGKRLGAVSAAVQRHVESNGFSVVRDYVGHGIGQRMHEDPQIPNFGSEDTGPILKPGMVLAIEPMVNAGTWEVETALDNWTVKTVDGKLSAHFEHTVAVTDDGPQILTLLE